jgi:hypothetical protein
LELCCNDYKWNVENFISFPEYLVACHLDLKNSSYEVNKQLLFTVMILIDSSFMCLLHVLLSVTYALMKVKLEHLRSWETCVNAWCCLLCYLSMIDWVMFKLSIAKYLSVFSVNYACLAYCLWCIIHCTPCIHALASSISSRYTRCTTWRTWCGVEPKDGVRWIHPEHGRTLKCIHGVEMFCKMVQANLTDLSRISGKPVTSQFFKWLKIWTF